jgi:hypothetical protein
MLGARTGHGEPGFLAAAVLADDEVSTVMVLLAELVPGVTLAGLKLTVAPGGNPEAVSVTALLKTSPFGVVATTML